MNETHVLSKAQLARQLGVSRTFITLLAQGKRQPGQLLVGKIRQLGLTGEFDLLCANGEQAHKQLS
jgi:transcriptional regulator with XRE-family HTH domain